MSRSRFVVVVALALITAFGCTRSGKGRGSRAGRKRRYLRPPWYVDVSKAKLHPQSRRMITWLQDQGNGWGSGRFRIDLSMHVLTAKKNTPMRSFHPTDDFFSPDCDDVKVPLPKGGAIEGETGYHCKSDPDGDCHLIVYHPFKKKLYEMWRANIKPNGEFDGGCLVVWDLTKPYSREGRGQGCTSADASGLPIAPLLFTPEEIHAGAINHAMRFILPNYRIRGGVYFSPATHSTQAASGGPRAIPFGARFRLRADYPLDKLPSKGARVIARALQKYGMFLVDGGLITLTGRNDYFSSKKYKGVLGTNDLNALKVLDFEVIDADTYRFGGACIRAD